MTIEIELKFLVADAHIEQLKEQLAVFPHRYSAPVMLANHYYETADNQLRRWDMGLRIRGRNDQYEMTLKTAGQEIGGLHQRPEYNVALTDDQLDISLLPNDVWPAGTDTDLLQSQLTPLFSTDFTREKWVVTYQQSEIEIAFDRGQINAGLQSLPIQELELELLQGERSDLFSLAQALLATGGLRLGWQSKAARGYGLAQGVGLKPLSPFTPIAVAAKADCEQGLITLLSTLLRRWQLEETHWLGGDRDAARQISQTLLAIRETLTLFGGLVPRQVSSQLRQNLLILEPTLQEGEAREICFSAEWGSAQLYLTQLIVEKPWLAVMNTKQTKRLASSFKRFCDVMLSRNAAELKVLAHEPVIDQQIQVTQLRLDKLILSMYLLSSAYPINMVDEWLQPWLQAAEALRDNPVSAPKLPLSTKPKPPFWLASNTHID